MSESSDFKDLLSEPNMLDCNLNYYQSNEQFETRQEFNKFVEEQNKKFNDMYNFFTYNRFCDNKVTNMKKVIELQEDMIKRKEEIIVKKDLQIDSKERNLNYYRDESKKFESDAKYYKGLLNKKRSRDDMNLVLPDDKKQKKEKYIDKFKKPKGYRKLKDINKVLERTFKNMNSIEDIINLENEEHKWSLISNEKFAMLFEMIPTLKEINSVIGMKKVKVDLFKYICYFIQKINSNDELLHTVITGSPGTGKTMIATFIAKIFLSLGFLKNDKIVYAKRANLIGEYCGHTARLTQKRIDEAEGGVLLIDEAYSLGNKEKRDVFTKECIDTINQNLTEKKGKFICIIIGYKQSLDECFFSYNQGLKRRFPITFDVSDYTPKELTQIFDKKVKDNGYTLKNFDAEKFFTDNYKKFEFFGGDIELLVNNCKYAYSMRLMKDFNNKNDKVFTKDDIETGFQDFLDNRKVDVVEDKFKHPPPMMYT